MTNLLDERIDQYQGIDWTIVLRVVHPYSTASTGVADRPCHGGML